MNCEGVRDRLSAYVDEELDELSRLQVRSHLQRCQPCAAEEAALRSMVGILHEVAEATEVAVPADFRQKLRARLQELPPPVVQPRKHAQPPLWRRWRLPAAAAAVAAGITFLVNAPALPQMAVFNPGPSSVISEPAPNGTGPVASEMTPASGTQSGTPGTALPSGSGEPASGPDQAGQPQDLTPSNNQPPSTVTTPAQPAPTTTPAQPQQGPDGPPRVDDGQTPNGGHVIVASPGEPEPSAVEPAPVELQDVTYRTQILATVDGDFEARLNQVLAAYPGATLVGDPLPDGSGSALVTSFILSVPHEAAEALLAELETLGQPKGPRPVPEVVSRTAEYAAKRQSLAEKQQSAAYLEQSLLEPGLSDAARTANQASLNLLQEEIAALQAELEQMESRAARAWIILTVETPAAKAGE